jgi:hypothetical protein
MAKEGTEEPVGEESWFAEEQRKVEERYRRNKEARMRELRAAGVEVMPDFRTIDEVVDYYARLEEERGAGREESVDEESAAGEGGTDEDGDEDDSFVVSEGSCDSGA